ncbi:hypothetical protein J2Q11_00300 [Tenacibaculum finnmarkense genomovar finnmarkense]|uniref:hypothetical protein n=1 Tax=Tenacibaculum finnmarkense TaxID=2781243 RepID=UPI001E28FB20|nr:hypothetical protein [Tenacibaculum finnmarkense]MCD8412604.1 hypothetical protein [Tenacibaculum finnmarkense genomovar ulcerans]MCD8416771.1 hypothetical protein [Tenacibaculum finnmarkense genomovar finnmarkense]MCG8184753.1 hypothetical protein [Tenacibaculum finnmarkense genomovar finnmarkense]MCG8201631.1 hypothetical protein [Tenacibaculum finnmarkense genomovar finnmarkense]MCG8206343.1 hypothetical protein [Tenacibaculum finnmarkense genomovar finnmarkense]
MKKVILVVAMVFATGSFVNANTNEVIANDYKVDNCIEDAWDYGTGKSDEYAATDWYYNTFC